MNNHNMLTNMTERFAELDISDKKLSLDFLLQSYRIYERFGNKIEDRELKAMAQTSMTDLKNVYWGLFEKIDFNDDFFI